MFLSPSLKWFRNGAFVISFFPQRQRQTQSGERGSGVGFGKGWERVKGGKREASGQYTRTRANFEAKHPKGGEKERREQKLLGHNFFLFLFSSFFFFSGLERVAKHDFYGIVLQSGSVKSVKSSQTRRRAGRAERKGERGRQGLSVRVRMFLCTCAHVFCVFV